jgi:hypothetical protein
MASAVGFSKAIERTGRRGKAPLEVLPAAFYLPAESFSSQDISFEGYYNRMPPGRIDRIPTKQQNVLSLSLPFPY